MFAYGPELYELQTWGAAGATHQGQSEVPAPGTKVRHRQQDGEKVVILPILLIQWEQ